MAFQYLVGGKPDSIADLPQLQVVVHLRLGKGSISPEQQPYPSLSVSLHDRRQDLPPALSAMDITRPQHGSLAISKLIEEE